jgi:glycine dehydrogenase subunit 1
MGKTGLRKVAELCYHKAHYAAEELEKLDGFSVWNKRPFFNEFVLKVPKPVGEINQSLLNHKIIGGFDLGEWKPEFEDHMLIAVTERNSKDGIDQFVAQMKEAANA